MLFSKLAEYFEQLDHTTSRNTLVAILADLYSQCDQSEVRPITYLLQGRLAPFFKPIEIGMGINYVADAIGKAFGVDRKHVMQVFDRVGDIGTAARQVQQEAGKELSMEETPTVLEIFNQLMAISQVSGPGSIEKKIGMFADILQKLDPRSVTYICRIPVGTLRLGVGDPTILDALSFAKSGDKSLRKPLERAYNETSDLGLIAETLWKDGIEGVEKLSIMPGNPVRPALAERLPTPEAIINRMGQCAVEKKYDGFRCQVHKIGNEVKIFSRNLEDMTGMFPEITSGTLAMVDAETAIFEGEALAYHPLSGEFLPFQVTTKRRRKHKIEEAAQELPLKLFAFDILYKNGENLMGMKYVDRREILANTIKGEDSLIVSEWVIADNVEKLMEVFNEAIESGLEGIVAKRLDSPYQAGARNFNWVKLKRTHAGQLQDTVDCVIVGYIYGRGKRAQLGAGALLVAVYNPDKDTFQTITKIGTGLTDEEWKEVVERCKPYVTEEKPARVESIIQPSVWVEPAVVIEVLADEITRSPVHTAGMNGEKQGYALRFPRLVSFRESDKRPEDATTVQEIIEMYQQQAIKQVAS